MINLSDRPWIHPLAADRIMEFLRGRKDPAVFEWGSGGSTLWFARQGARVVSIEHDAEWVQAARHAQTINDRVVVKHLQKTEPVYWECIKDEEGQFDVIMVDGRNRVRCVEQAIPKLLSGGMLVLDDSQRDHYRKAILLADIMCSGKTSLVEAEGRKISLWLKK